MKLEIPVEPHVYKFLTSNEMFGSKLPLKARKDNLLGMLIIMLATKGTIELDDYYHERLLPVIPDELVKLPVSTTFIIKEEFIREENLMYAGEVLAMMFEMQVIFYTQGYMARQGSERGAISKLYQSFGLEDDPIKQEALRGMSKRYRKQVLTNYQKGNKKNVSHSGAKVSQFASKLSQKLQSCPTQKLS